MFKQWSRAGKVAFSVVLALTCILGLSYGVFLKVTDVGKTLRLEPEIQRKAIEYGMYSTKTEYENAVKTMPLAPRLETAISEVITTLDKGVGGDIKTREDQLGFLMFGTVAKKNDRLPNLRSTLADCESRLEKSMSAAPVFNVKTWTMEQFFANEPSFNDLGRVQEYFLYVAWLEAQAGNIDQAIENLRFEATMRRYFSSSAKSHAGAVYAVFSDIEASLSHLRILQKLKRPNPNLIRVVKECEGTPVPFGYRHLCRIYFYLGADWFPLGQTISELARPEDKFWRIIPRLEQTWKLHIQHAAILAYEAGGKESEEIDALHSAIQTFGRSSYDGEWARMSTFWAIPKVVDSSSFGSFNKKDIRSKLEVLLNAKSNAH